MSQQDIIDVLLNVYPPYEDGVSNDPYPQGWVLSFIYAAEELGYVVC